MDNYHKSRHCCYLTQYHIVWCPKFRYPVLKDGVDEQLKTILYDICAKYNFKIKALEVMPDHIHIFVDVPQTYAPSQIVCILKSMSAIALFRNCEWLRSFYSRCGEMWSDGYFISSVGYISETTVRKYIENQKHEKTKARKN